jgi:hypothetical protein
VKTNKGSREKVSVSLLSARISDNGGHGIEFMARFGLIERNVIRNNGFRLLGTSGAAIFLSWQILQFNHFCILCRGGSGLTFLGSGHAWASNFGLGLFWAQKITK